MHVWTSAISCLAIWCLNYNWHSPLTLQSTIPYPVVCIGNILSSKIWFYVSLLPPSPPASFVAASLTSCSLPDNREQPRPVFSATPQPRVFAVRMNCEPSRASAPWRTSTATICGQCSLPDRGHLRPGFPAGPQPRERMPGRMSEDMPERLLEWTAEDLSERMYERMSLDMSERVSQERSESMSGPCCLYVRVVSHVSAGQCWGITLKSALGI